MKNVMSVRLDNKTLRRLRELSNRENKEVSTVARELIDQGLELVTLREYREGKLSLGSVAKRLDLSLSEVIDLLAELPACDPRSNTMTTLKAMPPRLDSLARPNDIIRHSYLFRTKNLQLLSK